MSTTTRRYSGRQLTIAKCLVAAVAAVGGGVALADGPEDRPLMVVGTLIVLGGALLAYELLARGLAMVFGRVWRPATTAPATRVEPKPRRRRLRVWQPIAAVGGFFGAQALVWLIPMTIVGIREGVATDAVIDAAMLRLVPTVLPASMAASGLALVLTLRAWTRRLGARTVGAILAARWGTAPQLGLAAAGGAIAAMACLALADVVPYEHDAPSFMVQAAATPGPARWAWLVSALVLAPPLEEVLFRGAFLGSIRAIWNVPAAAIISGLTFWLLHAPEWVTYWPAALALGLLTVHLTALRIGTRALGPCVAAHFAYNALLAFASFGFELGNIV